MKATTAVVGYSGPGRLEGLLLTRLNYTVRAKYVVRLVNLAYKAKFSSKYVGARSKTILWEVI